MSPKQLLDFEVEALVPKGLAHYGHADQFRKDPPPGFFILVPPKPQKLDLDLFVSLIETTEGIKGRNCLDPRYVKDEIETPEKQYLMLDLSGGEEERINADPLISRTKILHEGRSPYTVWRGIIHAVIFPEFLDDFNRYLVGSRDELYGDIPYLCLYRGEPRLDSYRYVPYAFPGWCAPSCGSIIV